MDNSPPQEGSLLETGELTIDDLLHTMVERGASDLHIKVGSAPMIRVDGELTPATYEILTPESVRQMCESILTDEQKAKFIADKELDLAYSIPGLSRFRVNIYLQRGTWGAAIRVIPSRPLTLDELKMPAIVKDLAMRPRGLVLVTGPTGVGKTTVLNAMVDLVNSERRARIVAIEDPIEFLHTNKRSLVIQRELDSDTPSFQSALMAALRQDPNVICVGEMRSLQTVATALTAAETGHLVMATLHTQSASQTVDRIIDVFPAHQQNQVRMQLAGTLQGVISLQLLPRLAEKGRVMAYEIMLGTLGIRNVIRQGKIEQLGNLISMGAGEGMVPMDRCLRTLYERGEISYDTALARALNPQEFRALRAPSVS